MRLQKSFALLCLFCLAPTYAQRTAPPRPKASVSAALAKPQYWSAVKLRLFKTPTRETRFTFATSWIPGPDHKGMFRYRLAAIPETRSLNGQLLAGESDTPENTEKFLERVHACDFTMVLYDSDGFLLRRVPILFQRGVNDDAQLISLSWNSSEQMDQEEYVSLLGIEGKGGRWDVTWAGC
jgi:hypothetical protein